MTLGSHQTSIGKTQVHITPRWIIEVLGPFDLDPAAADPRPWDCAAVNYTERDDGLRQPWFGRPFLNPPFDRYVVPHWIRKLARHGCGTVSIAVQHGADPETIRSALCRDSHGRASGPLAAALDLIMGNER